MVIGKLSAGGFRQAGHRKANRRSLCFYTLIKGLQSGRNDFIG